MEGGITFMSLSVYAHSLQQRQLGGGRHYVHVFISLCTQSAAEAVRWRHYVHVFIYTVCSRDS